MRLLPLFASLCLTVPAVGQTLDARDNLKGLTNPSQAVSNVGALGASLSVANGAFWSIGNAATGVSYSWGFSPSFIPQELLLQTDSPTVNVLALQNNSAKGFSVLTARGADPFYPDATKPFEHLAIGWGNAGVPFDFLEISSFDTKANPLIPPSAFRIQQTGGVDPAGGTEARSCTLILGSKAISCTTKLGANGTLIGPPAGLDIIPATLGVPAATILASGGGTTDGMMSAAATLSATRSLSFTSPTYAQREVMTLTRTGGGYFHNWDGSTNFGWDRVNKRFLLDADIRFDDVQSHSIYTTGASSLTLSSGNHLLLLGDSAPGGLTQTSVQNTGSGTGTLSALQWRTGTDNSSFSLALLEQGSHSIGLLSTGSFVDNFLLRGPRFTFQDPAGTAAAFAIDASAKPPVLTLGGVLQGPLWTIGNTGTQIPPCNGATQLGLVTVIDAKAPVVGAAPVGGGASRALLFCNGGGAWHVAAD